MNRRAEECNAFISLPREEDNWHAGPAPNRRAALYNKNEMGGCVCWAPYIFGAVFPQRKRARKEVGSRSLPSLFYPLLKENNSPSTKLTHCGAEKWPGQSHNSKTASPFIRM